MTLVLLSLISLSSAEDKVKVLPFDSNGGHMMATHVTDFPVDAEGNRSGDDVLWHHRWRNGLVIGNDKIKVYNQWDIFTGQFGGNTWAVPGTVDARRRHVTGLTQRGSFKPRRASVEANLPGAQIEAGLLPSHWGLGMVANDGAHDPWFGVTEFGDRVIRMRVSTKPDRESPLSFTVSYDRVVEDDMARWSDGQWADQGVMALMYADPDGHKLGIYGVMRHQEELFAERETRAQVLDVYGSTPLPVGGSKAVTFSAEVAGISGHTDRATTYASPDMVQIRSAGATGVLSYGTQEDVFSAHLGGGWASGDGNPDDDVSNDFRFDRDFGVGQVLFDEYLGAVEAAAHHTLSDPQYSGQAPDGLDATVTEGAFQRASFVQPVIDLRPKDWLHLRVGGAVSWATGPIGQRFYSYRAGGVPHNHHNQPTSGHYLGSEIDWTFALGGNMLTLGGSEARLPSLVVSGGHLQLGPDLSGAGPDRIDLYRVMLRGKN